MYQEIFFVSLSWWLSRVFSSWGNHSIPWFSADVRRNFLSFSGWMRSRGNCPSSHSTSFIPKLLCPELWLFYIKNIFYVYCAYWWMPWLDVLIHFSIAFASNVSSLGNLIRSTILIKESGKIMKKKDVQKLARLEPTTSRSKGPHEAWALPLCYSSQRISCHYGATIFMSVIFTLAVSEALMMTAPACCWPKSWLRAASGCAGAASCTWTTLTGRGPNPRASRMAGGRREAAPPTQFNWSQNEVGSGGWQSDQRWPHNDEFPRFNLASSQSF